MMNKFKTEFGFVVTDWKTNKKKNFQETSYTKRLKDPFGKFPDTALGHYYLQLPLYAKLLLKMLEGTKYADVKPQMDFLLYWIGEYMSYGKKTVSPVGVKPSYWNGDYYKDKGAWEEFLPDQSN
jgi:hypothetical protein